MRSPQLRSLTAGVSTLVECEHKPARTEEAMACLRDDVATAIRQRVEMPDFADSSRNGWTGQMGSFVPERMRTGRASTSTIRFPTPLRAALGSIIFPSRRRAVGTAGQHVYTELTTLDGRQ